MWSDDEKKDAFVIGRSCEEQLSGAAEASATLTVREYGLQSDVFSVFSLFLQSLSAQWPSHSFACGAWFLVAGRLRK